MQTVRVQVERDYLERLAARNPIASIEELIWNALDADATTINVRFDRNELGGINGIIVEDNGHGLDHRNAPDAFAKLGGSWKKDRTRTRGDRILHGKQGKGRFLSFALGSQVVWKSRYSPNGGIREYEITGASSQPDIFNISDPQPRRSSNTGMVVSITGISRDLNILDTAKAEQLLNEEFALYLRQYTQVAIRIDGKKLDPASIEKRITDYQVGPVKLKDGGEAHAELTIVEWAIQTERVLCLCDENGFTLRTVAPGIHAREFEFTAYLTSVLLREHNDEGGLELDELAIDVKNLIDAAKEIMKQHFRNRSLEEAGDLVEQWKKEEIYPYAGAPTGPIEAAKRQVFDVIALSVREYLPDFDNASKENKQLSFRLLKTALETGPDALRKILNDVLKLPAEKQKELADLLENTSLEAIINASKIVADRLNFLLGLEILVFDYEVKQKTLERRHLHKVVADHTWVFGEEFNLSSSDKGLNKVLANHYELEGKELLDDSAVLRDDGSQGIVDLVMARLIPQPRPENKEFLIVELKRPSTILSVVDMAQIEGYASAIVNDDRFDKNQTKWEFWLVGNSIDPRAQWKIKPANKPYGLLVEPADLPLRIWVKTWSQIIGDCRGRLKFFQEHLQYIADDDSAVDYLRQIHDKYLPKELSVASSQKPT